jgi:glycosyltransferase involved in cell wall biosynthesis
MHHNPGLATRGLEPSMGRESVVGAAPTRRGPVPEVDTHISVIVPVFRSEKTLEDLHRRLVSALDQIALDFEIIFVEDCGGDRSWNVIRAIAGSDSRVRGIKLCRNFGQHNALLCGIRAARYEIIVTLDDDLQNPPEEITKLVDKLGEGYDVVYGTPLREQHGFLRNAASRVTKLALHSAMGAETARHVSAFRAFRTPVREAFAAYRSPFVSIDVLLAWGTSRFAHVRVRHEPRKGSTSGYTLPKLISHALDMMTGFSTMPLQLASVIGFAFTLFGLLILIYVLARYLIEGGSVPGFPFLASIIAIFSGAQLFAIGIIGEYLARMHFRAMERPTYVVESVIQQTGGGILPITLGNEQTKVGPPGT